MSHEDRRVRVCITHGCGRSPSDSILRIVNFVNGLRRDIGGCDISTLFGQGGHRGGTITPTERYDFDRRAGDCDLLIAFCDHPYAIGVGFALGVQVVHRKGHALVLVHRTCTLAGGDEILAGLPSEFVTFREYGDFLEALSIARQTIISVGQKIRDGHLFNGTNSQSHLPEVLSLSGAPS